MTNPRRPAAPNVIVTDVTCGGDLIINATDPSPVTVSGGYLIDGGPEPWAIWFDNTTGLWVLFYNGAREQFGYKSDAYDRLNELKAGGAD